MKYDNIYEPSDRDRDEIYDCNIKQETLKKIIFLKNDIDIHIGYYFYGKRIDFINEIDVFRYQYDVFRMLDRYLNEHIYNKYPYWISISHIPLRLFEKIFNCSTYLLEKINTSEKHKNFMLLIKQKPIPQEIKYLYNEIYEIIYQIDYLINSQVRVFSADPLKQNTIEYSIKEIEDKLTLQQYNSIISHYYHFYSTQVL